MGHRGSTPELPGVDLIVPFPATPQAERDGVAMLIPYHLVIAYDYPWDTITALP